MWWVVDFPITTIAQIAHKLPSISDHISDCYGRFFLLPSISRAKFTRDDVVN
jgi:hypothetical protein